MERSDADLARAWQRTRDRAARDLLLERNLGLAYWWAAKGSRYFACLGAEYEDIVQSATIGLLRSFDTWDPDQGSLSHYAVLWIRTAIKQGMRPYGYRPERPPGPGRRPYGLQMDEETEVALRTRTASQPDPGPEIRDEIEALPEPQRTIVKHRLEGLTFSQIGQRMKRSREWVRQRAGEQPRWTKNGREKS